MACRCNIIPSDVLSRLAQDESIGQEARKRMIETMALDAKLRKLRRVNAEISRTAIRANSIAGFAQLAANPVVSVYDCKTTMSLPGSPVANPGASSDATAARAFTETKAVADFYKRAFGRSSIDDQGMTLISSIHYGSGYNNAFWNGAQMTYGDGDGSIFVDFTLSEDVIAHELTHGVTQHSAAFAYTNEAGGLNESMSDVFGSMFRQWRRGETAASATWLIGAEILGPDARRGGYTCLRDMADPGARHCLSPQPAHYSGYTPGMGPHSSSGIPNKAFHLFATALGGNSWDKAGKIWYAALTGNGRTPGSTFKAFADRTRKAAAKLFPGDAAVKAALDAAWNAVGVV